MIVNPSRENLFIAAMHLNDIDVNSHNNRKNLACTFLTRIKDPNYLDLNIAETTGENKFVVTAYEQKNKESCSFNTKIEAQKFIDTLCYLNSIDLKSQSI